MTKTITILAGIVLSVVLITGFNVPDAAAAGFLKLGDIKGESTDEAHKDWIDVLSIDWGASKKPTKRDGQFKQRGPVLVQDMAFTYAYEKASPKLLEALASGKQFEIVEFELTKEVPGTRICAGDDGSIPEVCNVTYLRYEMEKARITSYQTGGSTDDRPTETLALNFETIKVTYTEYDDAGDPVSETSSTVVIKGKKILQN
jgi:type VI secretion system secreted protein Hcp